MLPCRAAKNVDPQMAPERFSRRRRLSFREKTSLPLEWYGESGQMRRNWP